MPPSLTLGRLSQVTGKEKQDLYVKTITQELVREVEYVVDILADRAPRRAGFSNQIIEALSLGLGLVGLQLGVNHMLTFTEILAKGATGLVNYHQNRKYRHVGMIWQQNDPDKLYHLAELVAERLAIRYAHFLHEKLADNAGEVIKFAQCGVRRMLEYVARTLLPLAEDTLLQGAIEGRSGAYFDGLLDTGLQGRGAYANAGFTAEGAYAHAGFAVLSLARKHYSALTSTESTTLRKIHAQDLNKERELRRTQLEQNLQHIEQTHRSAGQAIKNFLLHKIPRGVKSGLDNSLDWMQTQAEKFYSFAYVDFINGDPQHGFHYGYILVDENTREHYGYRDYRPQNLSVIRTMDNYIHPVLILEGEQAKRLLEDYREAHNVNKNLSFFDYLKGRFDHSQSWPDYFRIICRGDCSGEDYSGLDFSKMDFSGSNFSKCHLQKTRFDDAYLYNCDFTDASAQESSWNGAQIVFSVLQNVQLNKASLHNSVCNYSDFTNADCSGMQHVGAQWVGADLTDIRSTRQGHLLKELRKEQRQQAKTVAEQHRRLVAYEDVLDSLQAQLAEKASRAELAVGLSALETQMDEKASHEEVFTAVGELRWQTSKLFAAEMTVVHQRIDRKVGHEELTAALSEMSQKPLTDEQRIAFLAREKTRQREAYLNDREIKPLFGKPFPAEDTTALEILEELREKKETPKEEGVSNAKFPAKQEQYYTTLQRPVELAQLFAPKTESTIIPNPSNIWLFQGPPGVGKTTFVKRLKSLWAKQELWPQFKYMLSVTLRSLTYPDVYRQTKEPYRLAPFIQMTCFPHLTAQQFNLVWEEIQALPPEEKIILLDGFDEISSIINNPHHPLHNCLQELFDKGSGWTVLVTSRPYGIEAVLKHQPHQLEIKGFTPENTKGYVQEHFTRAEQPEQAQQLLNRFQNAPHLEHSAQIPVIANIICGVQGEEDSPTNSFDSTTTNLYEAMRLKLLERAYQREFEKEQHPKQKPSSPVYVDLQRQPPEEKNKVLEEEYQSTLEVMARVAWDSLTHETLVITTETLNAALKATVEADPALARLKTKDKAVHTNQWRTEFETLGLFSPLHNERGTYAYEPLHLSLLEFLAAHYIILQLREQNPEIQTFIAQHKYNSRCQLVWAFVSGLVRNDDELLTRWVQCLQQFPHDQLGFAELALWPRCLEEIGDHTNSLVQDCHRKLKTSLRAWFGHFKSSVENFDHYSFSQPILEEKIDEFILECLAKSPFLVSKYIIPWLLESFNKNGFFNVPIMRKLGSVVETSELFEPILTLFHKEQSKDILRTLAWYFQGIGVAAVTQKVINVLAECFKEHKDLSVRIQFLHIFSRFGSIAATPKVSDVLTEALMDPEYVPIHGLITDVLKELGLKRITSEMQARISRSFHENGDLICLSILDKFSPSMWEDLLQDVDALVRAFIKSDENFKYFDVFMRYQPTSIVTQVLRILGGILLSENIKTFELSVKATQAASSIGPVVNIPEILACAVLSAEKEKKKYAPVYEEIAFDQMRGTDANNEGPSIYTFENLMYRNAVTTPEVIEALLGFLWSANEQVRESAVNIIALLQIERQDVMESLVTLLRLEQSKRIQNVIVNRLCNLRNPMSFRSRAAARLYFTYGEEYIENKESDNSLVFANLLDILERALQETLSSDARIAIFKIIGSMKTVAVTPKVLNALATSLRGNSEVEKDCVITTLGDLGPTAVTPDIQDAITEFLQNFVENYDTKRIVTMPSKQLWPRVANAKILRILAISLLRSKNSEGRKFAADIIGMLEVLAAIPVMLGVLAKSLQKEESVFVRLSVAEAIGKLASKSVNIPSSAVGALVVALKEDTQSIQREIDKVPWDYENEFRNVPDPNGSLGPWILVQVSCDQERIKEASKQLRVKAVSSLGKCGFISTNIVDSLLDLLRLDKDERVREEVVKVFDSHDQAITPKVLNVFATVLQEDCAENVRTEIFRVIYKNGSRAATPEIYNALITLFRENNKVMKVTLIVIIIKLLGGPDSPVFIPEILWILLEAFRPYHNEKEIHLLVLKTIFKLSTIYPHSPQIQWAFQEAICRMLAFTNFYKNGRISSEDTEYLDAIFSSFNSYDFIKILAQTKMLEPMLALLLVKAMQEKAAICFSQASPEILIFVNNQKLSFVLEPEVFQHLITMWPQVVGRFFSSDHVQNVRNWHQSSLGVQRLALPAPPVGMDAMYPTTASF